MNILIVCTGNTCRSPMAEGILKSMISPDDGIEVISGGIFANEGERVSENAVKALEEMGIDISTHTAHNLNKDVVRDADLILTMTGSHKDILCAMYGEDAAKKTYTLCEYAGKDGDIGDPYGQSPEVYRQCAAEMCDALKKVYEKIRS